MMRIVNKINFKKNKGFSLIELIVVIAIFGILYSVISASLSVVKKKGRDARRIMDIKQIQTALTMYSEVNGNRYPTTSGDVAGIVGLTPGYLSILPKDPSNNGIHTYKYAALGTGTNCASYHLGAVLEDVDNQSKNSDIDAVAGTVCTNGGTDFAGTDNTDCAGNVNDSVVCYDVKP